MTDITGQTANPAEVKYNQAESKNDQRSFIHEVSENSPFSSKISPAMIVALVVLAVVLVEAFITFGLKATADSRTKTEERDIQNANQTISTTLKDTNTQVAQIVSGLSAYQKYQSSQINYDALWSDLQARVVPNTGLKSLSVNSVGLVKIDGQATNFSDIATLIASLNQSTSIKNVVLVSSNNNGKNVDFSLTAKYLPTKQEGTK